MIKQIGLPLRGRPILLITRMITDRIGLHSVLLPLLTGYKCDILPACLILAYSDKIFVKHALSTPGLRAVHLVQRAQL